MISYVLIQKSEITNKLADYLADITEDIPQIDTNCLWHHHVILGTSNRDGLSLQESFYFLFQIQSKQSVDGDRPYLSFS